MRVQNQVCPENWLKISLKLYSYGLWYVVYVARLVASYITNKLVARLFVSYFLKIVYCLHNTDNYYTIISTCIVICLLLAINDSETMSQPNNTLLMLTADDGSEGQEQCIDQLVIVGSARDCSIDSNWSLQGEMMCCLCICVPRLELWAF